ncbi:hypothetical protein AAFF_G00141850 [Aldrovandia affinis]|uniref:Uncharacterized protein n=1 Tax=Aldrovandia affinis TaxID=143900 RepID=A0AAD7TDY2_9TELE|nr:hypothetical protein AAFF_G00141850 [Aldrovandia affinis]
MMKHRYSKPNGPGIRDCGFRAQCRAARDPASSTVWDRNPIWPPGAFHGGGVSGYTLHGGQAVARRDHAEEAEL